MNGLSPRLFKYVTNSVTNNDTMCILHLLECGSQTRSEKIAQFFIILIVSGCSLSRSVLAGGRRPLLLTDHRYRRRPTGFVHHGHCYLPLPWQGEVYSYGLRLHSVLNHWWVTGHLGFICGNGCTIYKFSQLFKSYYSYYRKVQSHEQALICFLLRSNTLCRLTWPSQRHCVWRPAFYPEQGHCLYGHPPRPKRVP